MEPDRSSLVSDVSGRTAPSTTTSTQQSTTRRFAPQIARVGHVSSQYLRLAPFQNFTQARAARQAVQSTLHQTQSQRLGALSAPLDYDNFVAKNRTALDADPLRELVSFPRDDVSVRAGYCT